MGYYDIYIYLPNSISFYVNTQYNICRVSTETSEMLFVYHFDATW